MRASARFQGGSSAITLFLESSHGALIRKTDSGPAVEKIRYQYEWLKQRETLPHVPKRVRLYIHANSASLDMEYLRGYGPLFSRIHEQPIERSKATLDRILDFLRDSIHGEGVRRESRAELDRYIQVKLIEKMEQCLPLVPGLELLNREEGLLVNGREYPGFHPLVSRIRASEKLLERLSVENFCPVHGDLTIENILVNELDFALIDPNGENFISDPLVDYAKLYQSLHLGYEFRCAIDVAVLNRNSIEFEAHNSDQYQELFEHLGRRLRDQLPPERLPLIKFHEGMHYARMLPYKARMNPQAFLAFYAAMIQCFSEFLDEAS